MKFPPLYCTHFTAQSTQSARSFPNWIFSVVDLVVFYWAIKRTQTIFLNSRLGSLSARAPRWSPRLKVMRNPYLVSTFSDYLAGSPDIRRDEAGSDQPDILMFDVLRYNSRYLSLLLLVPREFVRKTFVHNQWVGISAASQNLGNSSPTKNIILNQLNRI